VDSKQHCLPSWQRVLAYSIFMPASDNLGSSHRTKGMLKAMMVHQFLWQTSVLPIVVVMQEAEAATNA
jgi:hypothetical protein